MSMTPLSAETDSTPDHEPRIWPGNIALIIGWLVGMAAISYSVVGDKPYRFLALIVVMVPVTGRTALSLIRTIRAHRSKRVYSDIAAILEGGVILADERQRVLNMKAGNLAGSATVAVVGIGGMILCIAAAAAGVDIAGPDDWAILALAVMYTLLLTQNIVMIIAARVLSKKA